MRGIGKITGHHNPARGGDKTLFYNQNRRRGAFCQSRNQGAEVVCTIRVFPRDAGDDKACLFAFSGLADEIVRVAVCDLDGAVDLLQARIFELQFQPSCQHLIGASAPGGLIGDGGFPFFHGMNH